MISRSIGRAAGALLLSLFVSQFGASAFAAPRGRAKGARRTRSHAAAAPALPVLGHVPAFSYLDQDGHRVTDAELRGHVWIADFIFTHCTTACPIMSARMVQLQRRITDPSIRFISFSIDPEHDTPAVLKEYAARWTVDESRWRLLSTDKRSLSTLSEQMAAAVHETGNPNDPIDHNRGFLLIDATGALRGIYDTYEGDQLNKLLDDLDTVLARGGSEPAPTEAPPVGQEDGKKLFVALGCLGCHAHAKVASPLEGLYGRQVKLENGSTVKADEKYLRESIEDPAAKVAAGYPPTMPSYAGQITEPQLAALIAYVKSLNAPAPAATDRRVVVDPVCKMKISAGPETLHADHKGKRYYFCSESCQKRFSSGPDAFVAP